ncbi:MAG TPA: spermidine/putrescine ABC transporter substrate-binding protein [Actinomycetota bacterium]|nr:spermidine/putrescine ABC transporter substrate-binding protein [Actinomycetota bacterium]
MAGARDDPELNLLIEHPQARIGRRGFLRVGALLSAAGVAGCTVGSKACPPVGAVNRKPEQLINIYNWSDYIDDRTIPAFQAHSGIRVNYEVYSSNEDLLTRMRAGKDQWDIVVPTHQFLPTYKRLGLIQPLPLDLIPNVKNIDKAFVETVYDPGNKYSVPWQWGTTGIGYNAKRVPGGKVDSWKSIYDPDKSVAGRASLLRDASDLIACTLIYLGKDPNSVKDADLQEVVSLIRSLRGRIRELSSDTYIDNLAKGRTYIAQGWSGDVFQAADRNRDVIYVIPKEGALRWADVMCIPKDAPHVRNAALFINYVLQPSVNARISSYVSYGTPVPLSKALLPQEQLRDPSIYPPASTKLALVSMEGEKLKKWQTAYNNIVKA